MKKVAAGPSVLLLHPRAQKTRLARLEPDLPIHNSLFSPFRLLWHDTGFRKLPKVAPKDVVFLGKQASFHWSPLTE